jgi:hypothetical protein
MFGCAFHGVRLDGVLFVGDLRAEEDLRSVDLTGVMAAGSHHYDS